MSSDEACADDATETRPIMFKIITLRRPDRCWCGEQLDAGARAGWHAGTR